MKHRQPKREDWRMKPAKKRITKGKKWFNVPLNSESISFSRNHQDIATVVFTTKIADGVYRHAIEYRYIPTIITSTDTRHY